MTTAYQGLAGHLANATGSEVTLTFDELAELVGDLPSGARQGPWWWSNNEPANAQSKAWLDAGFRVYAVELEGFVAFVRVHDRLARLEVLRADEDAETLTGTMELREGVVVADEGARWLLEDGFYAAIPDGSWPRRVRPADGPAFLVGCWFSIRDQDIRGRLIDTDGHELTAEEGRTLVDSLSGVGTMPAPGEKLPGTDPSWSGVSLRAPDSIDDLDAAPFQDVFRQFIARRKELGPEAVAERQARPRPLPPTGDSWQRGLEMLDAIAKGSRVFDERLGQGTVLSVVRQGYKTEVLVRFDDGRESILLVMGLLVEAGTP